MNALVSVLHHALQHSVESMLTVLLTASPGAVSQDCKGSNTCLSMCKHSCAPPGINIEACKNVGTKMGEESAKFACDLTLVRMLSFEC